MAVEVQLRWDEAGLRSVFLSDGVRNALEQYSAQLAAQKEGELRVHLHAPAKAPLLASRVDRLSKTYVGTIHPANRIGYNLAKKYLR